ncbi:hypothetical protein Rsub_11317 [Raphidocelis subcapitata]|uniref:Helicase-associated domain-containing protein n=1 Tax=Raphidocelis subcapitata TaxID=307507 RepID=A0A2V0PHT6_9CHLO|nr:hypothetical protein Rsub_11317 [Raphidocelis subcapitata]|eukprot:GBF98592.1 hypothetical protein Rsub_11317 [Raphidocelis subcapitata]
MAESRERLLENYWEARGVFDPQQRQQLVSVAQSLVASAPAEATMGIDGEGGGGALPGVPTTWDIYSASPEVMEVSRRLVALHAVLGGGDDIDTVWMVVREPRLLAADPSELMRRLMAMRLASVGSGLDVAKVAEAQPSLLLAPGAVWDDLEALKEQLASWEHGVASDTDPEWAARLEQLRSYHRANGDCSVGCREGDDRELARWATKQRTQRSRGELPSEKEEALQALGFEFDEDEAEWLRWFLDLARFKELRGHASPMTIYLINWCSVQRVAHRCRALSARREGLLDSIGFDWAGADPLS